MSLRRSLLPVAMLALGLSYVVPALAQTATSTTTTTTKHTESTGLAKSSVTSGTAKTAPMKKVDINTASKDQLMMLPGIGDAIADKIIANRPFANKAQLLSKGLVNKAQYRAMAPHIVASHASMRGASNASTVRHTTTVRHTKSTAPATPGN